MNIKLKLAITALLGTALVGCTAPNALRTETAPDQQSYEIDGQRLDRIPVERLNALRLQYRREIQRVTAYRWPLGRPVKLVLR